MRELKHPVTHRQITAANRIYGKLQSWKAVDQAIINVGEKHSCINPSSILIKSVVINQLYFTNIYAIIQVSDCLCEQLLASDGNILDADHFEEINEAIHKRHGRNVHSFLSKFAHFFIDQDRFPILDSYAENTLNLHLGTQQLGIDSKHRYKIFCQKFVIFRETLNGTYGNSELDRYLWLAGQTHSYENSKENINNEVADWFSNHPNTTAEVPN